LFVASLLFVLQAHGGGLYVHDAPYQYEAGDMFWLASEAEGIKNSTNVLERPFFLMGGNTDAYNNFPLGLPVATNLLSYASNVENYDSMYHLNFFFAFMCIVMLYFILRKVHPYVAMIGTPLTLFFFKLPFSYPLNFGAQMSMMNMFVVFACVIAFMYLKNKGMFLVLGLLNGLGFYVHGRETLVLNVAVVAYFLYSLVKGIDWDLFRKYCLSIVVTVVTMIPILPLYFKTLEVRGIHFWEVLLSYCPSDTISHAVLFSDFGLLKWAIIAGIALVIVWLLWDAFNGNKLIKMPNLNLSKECVWTCVVFLAILFMSYFCVLGNKTTQIRHFFPFTLAIFFGFLFFAALTQMKENKWKDWIALGIAVLFLGIIVGTYGINTYPEYPLSNPDTMDAFKWIKENVSDSENILLLYGDNHYQATMFYLMGKTHVSVEQSDYASYIQQRVIPSDVRVLEGILGFYFVKNGTFNVINHGITFYSNKSLCDYDYVYFNIYSQNELVQEYTRTIGTILMEESGLKPVYQNKLVVILKNPNKGGECFESKQFSIKE
jgi:hypothetical protein